MNPIKSALYNLKSLFFGVEGQAKIIRSHVNDFPAIADVKKGIEAVIGRILSLTTTDATQAEMTPYKNGEDTLLLIPSETTRAFKLNVVARQTAGAGGTVGDSAKFTISGLIKKVGATTSLVDVLDESESKDAGAANWLCTVAADNTNDALSIKVTGEATKTIKWYAYLEFIEIA